MKNLGRFLKTRTSAAYLVAVVVVIGFALVSCGGGGYGGGGGYMSTSAPGLFNLSMPADMATSVTTTPTLKWTASPYATGYTVKISTPADTKFTTPIVNVGVGTALSYPVPPTANLLAGTTYIWAVVASNIYGMYTAPTFSFTT